MKCLKRKSKRAGKIRTLLARDGNLCWLCGEPFANKSGRKPSLDHVIPRSKGGSNRNENLRLAHGRCNWERGSAEPKGIAPAQHRHIDGVMSEKGARISDKAR